jgi:hypothetical protein
MIYELLFSNGKIDTGISFVSLEGGQGGGVNHDCSCHKKSTIRATVTFS